MDMTEHDLDKQIIFKLGSIEAHMTAMSNSMQDGLNRLYIRTEEIVQSSAKELAALRAAVEANEKEINALRDWKNTIVSKVIGATSTVALLWLVFGPGIIKTVERAL